MTPTRLKDRLGYQRDSLLLDTDRLTLVNQHDQPQETQLLDHRLHITTEPFRARRTPEDTDKQLPNQATVQQPIEAAVDNVQGDKEASLFEDCDNGRIMDGS